MNTIAVLDYGMGNVGSILNMFRKIGASAILTHDKKEIEQADKIVLPGVGAFDSGMNALQNYNLVELLKYQVVEKRKPLLGICLGMQMLGRNSEEGVLSGLGFIPFDNIRFSFLAESNLKIPHIGWNQVKNMASTTLTRSLPEQERYYFVHSYHAKCDCSENILMTCDYGYEFTAAVHNGNIFGVQFHPEKSHLFGIRILNNFVEYC
jgi:glutamine amidotransferase